MKYLLRVAYQYKAYALTDAGRHALAAAYWGRVAALENGRLADLFRVQQTISLGHLGGDHAPAFEQINAFAEAKDADGPQLYDTACFCSLAAGVQRANPEVARRYADRALELLRQAEAIGYFGQPGKLANFKIDTDLDPLRGRQEFREFLHELLRKEHAPRPPTP
jgi:hypothetical protein